MGLKEPGKREKANYGQYMMWKSENEPRQAQSNESKESVRVPFSLARRPKDPGPNDCGLVDWAWFTAAKGAV